MTKVTRAKFFSEFLTKFKMASDFLKKSPSTRGKIKHSQQRREVGDLAYFREFPECVIMIHTRENMKKTMPSCKGPPLSKSLK